MNELIQISYVSLYESKTAETAQCKVHWHKFIRVIRVLLIPRNHLPKHALANEPICMSWHREQQNYCKITWTNNNNNNNHDDSVLSFCFDA